MGASPLKTSAVITPRSNFVSMGFFRDVKSPERRGSIQYKAAAIFAAASSSSWREMRFTGSAGDNYAGIKTPAPCGAAFTAASGELYFLTANPSRQQQPVQVAAHTSPQPRNTLSFLACTGPSPVASRMHIHRKKCCLYR